MTEFVPSCGQTEEPLGPSLPVSWRFKLGEWITHKDQPLPSLVMGRVRTTKGREIYGVRSFMNVDPQRDRMILADSLKPIDDEAWAVCLLAGTQFDTRGA